MAVVKGVKEKVHLPLYDSINVKSKEQFGKNQSSNVLRFFQDVTGKTKLQTNMQAASLLPHWNTFEARSMRVVISDLPAQFPDSVTVDLEFDLLSADQPVKGKLFFNLRHFVALKRLVEGPGGKSVVFSGDGDGNSRLADLELKLRVTGRTTSPAPPDDQLVGGESITVDRGALKAVEDKFRQNGQAVPPNEQVFPNDGFGTLIGKFIYNTVTTFFVGEKVMIQVPTWFFPAGAGPYSEDGRVTTHGYPNPQATFRFAEPIFIDTQQNFRVEIEIPESDVLSDLQKLYGPLFIWVVLDGYMTRDVQ
ncbi:MAG TPA: hypothetical protein VKA70_06115 [Blastocatellia bacterium]|nr:hypothetical protein [Blastocatellia bacterium]